MANTSGISGVTEYNTAGWPRASSNGPAADALSHGHVPGAVTYSVTPPVGAVSITCQPSLPQSDPRLQQFVNKFRASRQYTP